MISDWLPAFCSRLSIFLSYASEDRPIAEKIAQTLKNDGHRVFFDKDSLPPAGDYNERIRKGVRRADRFVFLASRHSMDTGSYTLTELGFAKQKWQSPVGRVFPIIIDSAITPAQLPVYLSSVHALTIEGNVPAEIAAVIEKTGSVNGACWACLGVSTLALAGVIGLAAGVIPMPSGFQRTEIVAVEPQFVHFRPRARPPDDPSAAGADTSWTRSPVTITLPIAYSHRNARAAPAQVLGEEVELKLAGSTHAYSWTYVVEIVSGSIADTRTKCADWLCQKGNVKTETLKAGETTATRETMFLPVAGTLSWQEFIDKVTSADGPASAIVILKSRIAVADGTAKPDRQHLIECRVDVAGSRARMLAVGYRSGHNPRPPTWQPRCQKP